MMNADDDDGGDDDGGYVHNGDVQITMITLMVAFMILMIQDCCDNADCDHDGYGFHHMIAIIFDLR